MRVAQYYAKSLGQQEWVTRRMALKTTIERAKWFVDDCANKGEKVVVRIYAETTRLGDGSPQFDMESCIPIIPEMIYRNET